MNEEEAIKQLKQWLSVIDLKKKSNIIPNTDDIQAIETVLNLLEKKEKIINSIKEYAQQEIDFATEDIEDYIDDDKEGNKNIIGEIKEEREHWKDIIKIINNEKTYMNYL